MASSSGRKGSPSACTSSSLSPPLSARTLRASTPELSTTSGKAWGLPTKACDTDFASRCDCISDWPVAVSCCAERLACCSTQPAIKASTTKPTPSSISRRRWWTAVVARPSRGSETKSSSANSPSGYCAASPGSPCTLAMPSVWYASASSPPAGCCAKSAGFSSASGSAGLRLNNFPNGLTTDMVLPYRNNQALMLRKAGCWERACRFNSCQRVPCASR